VRRITLVMAWLILAAAVLAAPLAAKGGWPETIALPNGFRPEGIAIGKEHTFYVGSIPTGAIYRGDLKTGTGAIFIPGQAGRAAIGVEYDHGRLFVAGGPTGKGFVYSAETGALLTESQLAALPIDAANPTFVNDVALARGGAYFTDSARPFLYRLNRQGVTALPLTGDISYTTGNNANGIEATRNGKWLIVVQSNLGKLFKVDPRTGVAQEIKLDQPVVNGDGLLLDGHILYVVQNRDNKVAIVVLDRRLTSGRVLTHLTDPDFDVPSTIDEHGHRLYAVNARFTTPPTPTTPYSVVQLDKLHGKGKGRGH
jgi:sugar lactone lactonase YvrE